VRLDLGDNTIARSLHRELGFAETDVTTAERLDPLP
jgi:hypothetical protein